MSRHFGITNRPMSGGSTSTGSSGADTRAKLHLVADPSPSLDGHLPNSPSFYLEPFIPHRYDVGAGLLWLGLIVVPWIIVLGIVFAYMTLVAPFIQY